METLGKNRWAHIFESTIQTIATQLHNSVHDIKMHERSMKVCTCGTKVVYVCWMYIWMALLLRTSKETMCVHRYHMKCAQILQTFKFQHYKGWATVRTRLFFLCHLYGLYMCFGVWSWSIFPMHAMPLGLTDKFWTCSQLWTFRNMSDEGSKCLKMLDVP